MASGYIILDLKGLVFTSPDEWYNIDDELCNKVRVIKDMDKPVLVCNYSLGDDKEQARFVTCYARSTQEYEVLIGDSSWESGLLVLDFNLLTKKARIKLESY